MPQLDAYLAFDGTCAEAMRFYERVLDGKLEILMTNGESPMRDQTPPAAYDRILHARLNLDGKILMAGDTPPGMPYEGIKGVSMTLSYPSVADAQRVFEALAEGGQVSMPLMPSFWAETFGMLTDRYGTPWIVNGGMLEI